MRYIYTKPELRDMSQGSRIAFVRQFRHLSQDKVSDALGLTGECKRRTITRYEKGDRNPRDERISKISEILNVEYNSIKSYDYKNIIDLIYFFLWLEEILPNYHLDLSDVNVYSNDVELLINSLVKWVEIREKWYKREISYEEYIEWKLNFKIEEDSIYE